jgi:hypothetical protein
MSAVGYFHGTEFQIRIGNNDGQSRISMGHDSLSGRKTPV